MRALAVVITAALVAAASAEPEPLEQSNTPNMDAGLEVDLDALVDLQEAVDLLAECNRNPDCHPIPPQEE